MIDILPFWVWWLLGFAAGFGLELFLCSQKKDGVIHVTQGEESDKYLFEFNVPPEKIPEMNQIIFVVRIEEDSSQNLQTT